MTLPTDPAKREEALHNMKEAAQKRFQEPNQLQKIREMSRIRSQNPEWIRKQTELHQNPAWIRKITESAQKRAKDPLWIRNTTEASRKKAQDPEWIRKHKEGCQKLAQDPGWRLKNKNAAQKRAKDPNYLLKLCEGVVGGFCIQNIIYPDPPRYCEVWAPPLWKRIDEAQNYQSILSGKTKSDNICRDGKCHALSRHHVYWQKKACCEWDEDVNGYYAWIDVGTQRKPGKVKYYINGDPNKFVLLTSSEHQMIKKDKLKWIKIFEDLIETKLGGVCYTPISQL